jgi:phytol kinase
MIARELTSLLFTGCVFAAILVLAELLRSHWGVRAEATRKLVHVLSGLVGAAFPWLFATPWSVASLTASYALLMAWTRRGGWLRSVHGVDRRTRGGVCYPAAVALVFWLAHERPEVYVPSILVLALGDAAAALVGRAYGDTRYRTLGGVKSVEGSLAFLVVALPCVYVPLLLMTSLSPLPLLLCSINVALLTCGLEALAPDGSDNLLIPTACCLALLHMTASPVSHAWLLLAPLSVFGALIAHARGNDAEPSRVRVS